jgi:phage terminase large subunit
MNVMSFQWTNLYNCHLRTTFKIIIDFNPSEQYHWLYTQIIDADRDDVDFHISTYKDNPFLEQSTISRN